jgi:EAL domain-containing protein (putative c-di-GMP-specific phosphodiesterase class I)
VPPLEFIPIAEETGAIGVLGMHVLRSALVALAGWRADLLVPGDLAVSVNVSARQLDDYGFPDKVRAVLAAAGLPGSALRLEITESTLMQDPERVRGAFAAVCASGTGLHLDDFGTGYSSLTALNKFPVEALKIDRSFVSSLDEPGGGSEAIVRSTVALAHSLGLSVIAEGIETIDQLDRLRTLGCEYGQGDLFSKPLSVPETGLLLAGWSPADLAGLSTRV